MSSLRALLGDVVGGGSVPEKIFYVYNNNRGMTNNGCCCLWTVPASIKNVTFEVWGGGGAGAGACCCQWEQHSGGTGGYAVRTMTGSAGSGNTGEGNLAGCQFTICAAGNGSCCQAHCMGYTGYKSFVTGSSIPTTCAQGGCGGTTFCHAHHSYNCCHGWHCIDGASQGDFKLGIGRDQAMITQYCHNQMWSQAGGGVKSSSSRKGRDLCHGPMHCSGCGWGCSDDYPSGGSFSATACGNPCCWGQWSSGGMVKITYS